MLGRFQRSTDAAIFVAIALLALGVASTTLVGAARWAGRVVPGFVTWDDLVVVALGRPSWTGVDAGVPFRARVTHVDDRAIATGTALRARVAAAPVGTVHVYTFTGRDGPTTRAVPSMRFRWSDVLVAFGPYALNGLVFCITGLAVFYLKPEAAQSRALLMLGTTWGLTLLTALDLFGSGPFQHIYFLAEACAPAAVLHFALRFPEPTLPRLRLPLLYAASLVAATIEITCFRRNVPLLLAVNTGVYLALAASAFALIASIGIAAFRAASELAQRRARVVFAGLLAAFAVPTAAMLGFFLLGQPISFSLLAVTGFLFPLSIGYAVARHDLFEADRFIKRTLLYAALTTIVSTGYGSSVLVAERFAAGLALHRHPIFPVAFALAVIAILGPLRTRIQDGIDRLFYRRRLDYKSTIARATDRLATLLERDAIAAFVTHTIRADLGFERAMLVARDDPGLPEGLRDLREPLSRGAASESPRHHARRAELLATFDRLGAELLLPLRHQARSLGLLAIGSKGSGQPLSADDVDVLETLASATSVALATASAVAELREAEEQVRRHERLAAIGELAAAVAHGIRNPLAAIRLAAQLGLEGSAADDPLRENLGDVLVEVDRLESQVRGVLDFARPFQPTLGVVPLDELVREVLGGMRGPLEAAGVRADVDIATALPPVRGDEPHLRQLLHELLRNALDVCSSGGWIRVRLRLASTGPARLRLTIADSGPGVPADQVERIFRPFVTTKADGTGVGLAVVRKIVEAHDGTISLTTSAPMGAEFAIELPIGLPNDPTAAP